MALVDVSAIKDYLKIQGSAEDTPLAAWRLSAIAEVEAELGMPIETIERTFVIEAPIGGCLRKLFVPLFPVAVENSSAQTADLALTDGNGNTLVEDTDFRLDVRNGVITPLTGSFSTFPYTIECSVGLSALTEYTERVEPVVNAAILDTIADRYQRRNPAATSEGAGGGVVQSYTGGLPQRVRDLLAPFRVFPIAV